MLGSKYSEPLTLEMPRVFWEVLNHITANGRFGFVAVNYNIFIHGYFIYLFISFLLKLLLLYFFK